MERCASGAEWAGAACPCEADPRVAAPIAKRRLRVRLRPATRGRKRARGSGGRGGGGGGSIGGSGGGGNSGGSGGGSIVRGSVARAAGQSDPWRQVGIVHGGVARGSAAGRKMTDLEGFTFLQYSYTDAAALSLSLWPQSLSPNVRTEVSLSLSVSPPIYIRHEPYASIELIIRSHHE